VCGGGVEIRLVGMAFEQHRTSLFLMQSEKIFAL
jgi:hypothetical protein